MAGKILVPLGGSDRIEQFLPYIEQVARPGVKIVFLVHSGLSGLKALMDEVLALQTGITPASLPGTNHQADFVKERVRSAEKEVLAACAALRNREVDIVVNVYAGSLRRALREHMQRDDIHLVMMRPGAIRVSLYLRMMSRWFKPAMVPPVLLLYPGH
jgi:hypothetical protein